MSRLNRSMGVVCAVMGMGFTLSAWSAEPFTPDQDLAGDWGVKVDPKLPNVLILGDSISIGYTRDVRERLAGKANVLRLMRKDKPVNCGDTRRGMAMLEEDWFTKTRWDVIHFNWGLHDLCYRLPDQPASKNKEKGKQSVLVPDYAKNLQVIVDQLKKTKAKLIWASTTYVPEGESGRVVGDDVKYNAAAAEVMKKNEIPVNDLHKLTASFKPERFTARGNVHYTKEGSAKLGEQVAGRIAEALGVTLEK